jgi:hypothetical protein
LAQVALIRPGAAGRTEPVEAPKRAGDTQVNHIEHRVRERAYRIWLDEGRPEGRADLHWEMASELVVIEESPGPALQPNPLQASEQTLARDEPVDQGEERTMAKRAPRKSAAAKAAGDEVPKAAIKRTAAKASAKDAKTAVKPAVGKQAKPLSSSAKGAAR